MQSNGGIPVAVLSEGTGPRNFSKTKSVTTLKGIRMTRTLQNKLVLAILVVVISAAVGTAFDSPVVEIQQGTLVGNTYKSRLSREFYGYLGVPYGRAGRFQGPQRAEKWDGLLKAQEKGTECAQCLWLDKEILGKEDCLTLHVFSHDLKANHPVIVYFHGGGFSLGTANYFGAEYFMDEDVVVVLVNYRLGILGFLSTQDEILPGNYGLKDQSLALKWVQDNIAAFGGNPFSVTILGNSAGGASVNYQVVSPLNKGLIHGAIAFSGSSLSIWARSRNPLEIIQRYSKLINCPFTTSKEYRDCLNTKTAEELLATQGLLDQWGYDPFNAFGPVIEPDLPGAFMTEEPAELLRKGTFNRVPVMTGVCEDEGILMNAAFIYNNETLLKQFNEDWERVYPITLEFDELYEKFTPAAQKQLAARIRQYYFRNEEVVPWEPQNLIDVFSDRLFIHGVRDAAALMARHVPVYNYIFAHSRGDYVITKFFGIDKNYGVSHGDEMSYIFKDSFDIAPDFQKGSEGEKVSKQFVRLLVSFAKNKAPTSTWGSAVTWPPMSRDEVEGKTRTQYYRFDADTRFVDEPWSGRIEFWNKILKEAKEMSEMKRDEL